MLALQQAAESGDAEAAFRLGRWHAGQRDFDAARRWFAAAAAAGHAAAANELGVFALYALDREQPDAVQASEHFRRALAAGNGEAGYRLALIALGERVFAFDAQAAMDGLHRAARAGYAPAQRALGLAWLGAGDAEAARAAFVVALNGGDVPSAFLLGRLESGAVADGLLGWAAAHGLPHARAYARAAAPPPSLPALALPSAPSAEVLDAALPAPREHRAKPYVATFEGVFSTLECEYVMALASAQLRPSQVIDAQSGERRRHPNRTSSSMAFSPYDDDVWLRVLQRRLARLAGLPLHRAEELAVLRYAVGEEYRPHRDYLRPGDPAEFAADRPGQRVRTIFCYLNDVPAGGATDFPLLGVRIEPRQGRVVMFDNVLDDGTPDASTLHAGMPVERGEKWLATLWLRERSLRAY